MENLTIKQRMANIFRKYGYYILLGVVLLSIIVTVSLISARANRESNNANNNVPVVSSTTPCMPVLNATIYKGYYGDSLAFNETLRQWETHKSIDFAVAENSKVYSILDGVVESVSSNVLDGTVVVVKHNNGLMSTYGSLGDGVTLKAGDSVLRGGEIGVVSTSASSELSAGSHLHFSLLKDGEKIDPSAYLNISAK